MRHKPRLREKKLYFMLREDFFWSQAFQEILTMKSAVNLLIAFIEELRFRKVMNYRQYYNNGCVIFTEIEYIKEGLGSSSTYLRARNKLIEVGFIRISYKAEKKYKGICNQYKILVPNRGVPESEQRWRKYPLRNWSHEIPKEPNTKVGIKTRFLKSTPTNEGRSSLISEGENTKNGHF